MYEYLLNILFYLLIIVIVVIGLNHIKNSKLDLNKYYPEMKSVLNFLETIN